MIITTKATNVSSHATTADHARAVLSSAPPRRTVRTDFPYTAHRQSLGIRHARGVDSLQTLKINKSIAFKTCIQGLIRPKGFAPPLAPVSHKSAKPTPCKVIDITKHLTRIAVVKIIRPAPQYRVDLHNGSRLRLFVPTACLGSDFLLQSPNGIPGCKHIQVVPVAALQVAIKSQGKPRKSRCCPSSLIRTMPVLSRFTRKPKSASSLCSTQRWMPGPI